MSTVASASDDSSRIAHKAVDRSASTLVALLVVIAIIAMLVTLVLPTFSNKGLPDAKVA